MANIIGIDLGTTRSAVAKIEEGKKVLEEKRKGYMFGDKVLRESEVVVEKSSK